MTPLLPVLIIVVPLIAGEDKPAEPSIRGKWEVTAVMFNGTTFAHLKGRVLEFEEKDFLYTYDGEVLTNAAGHTPDGTANPKRIDLGHQEEGSKKALGIYAIEKDELRLCYAEPGAERPAKFESKPGGRVFLLVLKRVKE